ncbi:putative F-box protein AUF1 [Helianthus annuus]|nr:putative F-box protein AUF1 [Helianthus annuus]
MPMLTTLTLSSIILQDHHLHQLNKCFPNLQVLELVGVDGLKDPKIHLLNLQTCHLNFFTDPSSLTLITPNSSN